MKPDRSIDKSARDAALLALPPAEFEQVVSGAFRAAREGTLAGLNQSPLAESSLVEDCWLAGELPQPAARASLLLSALRWAVDSLRPATPYHPAAPDWRPYRVLHAYYLQNQRAGELAGSLGIVENHLFEVLRKALAPVIEALRGELAAPRHLPTRRQYALEQRYLGLPPAQQKALRAAAIFDQPVPAGWLRRMSEGENAPSGLDGLLYTPLIQVSAPGDAIRLLPELRLWLLPRIEAEERQALHRQAARSLIEERQDYLGGAAHWREAGSPRLAAQILVEHAQDLISEAGLPALSALLDAFQRSDLGGQDELWARLKLLAGEAAEGLNDLEKAAAEYRQARRISDVRLQARACYRLAHVMELSQRLDEALTASQDGLELLETAPHPPLQAALLIHRAWIFIQNRPDGERARGDLEHAERLLAPHDLLHWIDLRNAWAGYYTLIAGDPQQAVQQRLLCWMLANELGEADKLLIAGLNLGTDYAYLQQYDQARRYLEQGLELARSVGHLSMQGQYLKVLGNCCFFEERFSQAIELGEGAYEIFEQAGNQQWLAHTGLDLAEAYAQIPEWTPARRHWQNARRLAQAYRNQALLADLEGLAAAYPELAAACAGPHLTPAERRRHILAYVRQQGAISNEDCRRLTGVSPAQARRDLKDLLEAGQLAVTGQNRTARYVLPE